MENKKWTDTDLRTAFEDGCKFLHFKDLQDFLLKRRQLADTSEGQLTIPAVIKSVCPECKGEPTTINTVRYFFCEKCKKVGQTVL